MSVIFFFWAKNATLLFNTHPINVYTQKTSLINVLCVSFCAIFSFRQMKLLEIQWTTRLLILRNELDINDIRNARKTKKVESLQQICFNFTWLFNNITSISKNRMFKFSNETQYIVNNSGNTNIFLIMNKLFFLNFWWIMMVIGQVASNFLITFW